MLMRLPHVGMNLQKQELWCAIIVFNLKLLVRLGELVIII